MNKTKQKQAAPSSTAQMIQNLGPACSSSEPAVASTTKRCSYPAEHQEESPNKKQRRPSVDSSCDESFLLFTF